MRVYAVVDDALSPDFPLGVELEAGRDLREVLEPGRAFYQVPHEPPAPIYVLGFGSGAPAPLPHPFRGYASAAQRSVLVPCASMLAIDPSGARVSTNRP
jgi:hypothetical protein